MNDLNTEEILKSFKENYRVFEYLILKELLTKEDCRLELKEELNKMQNPDGGFRGLLEPDIRSGNSAVISTVAAMELYRYTGNIDEDIRERLEAYLNEKYDSDYQGWHVVSGDIYDKPRAAWWNREVEASFNYANPTAQIVGYADNFSLDLAADTESIYQRMIETELDTDNMHAYNCLVSMFRLKNQSLPSKLLEAGEKLVEWDENKWNTYVLGPSDVIDNPGHPLFAKYEEEVLRHLEYQKKKLLDEGYIDTSWKWNQYEESFGPAQLEWRGILTLKLIRKLKEFKML